MSSWLVGGYLAGVAVALAASDDRWTVRLALALVWPLGPLAFVVVVGVLLAAAAVIWPLAGAALLAACALAAWLL